MELGPDPPMVLLRAKDSDGHSSLAGKNHCPTTLVIQNDSCCKLERARCESHQIDDWETFPEVIEPNSRCEVLINFMTNSKINANEDHGECSYQVFGPDGFPLSEVTISADASQSSGLLGTFTAVVKVRWGNLPNVFGMTVGPLDGDLGFKHKGNVCMTIDGKPLKRGEKDEDAPGKTTDWMTAEELDPQVEIGDIVAVDRKGILRHYGIMLRRDDDGKAILAHLNGTAEDVLGKYKLEAAKQVVKALRKHGDIAEVAETTIPDFATGDPVRIENAYDNKTAPFTQDVIVERIKASLGYRDYSLREFNCEHYVHLMRYGLTYSGQIEEMRRMGEKFKLRLHESEERLKQSVSLNAAIDKIQDSIDELKVDKREIV